MIDKDLPCFRFDSLIFDLNGTLSIDRNLYPDVINGLTRLREKQVPLFLVSNAHAQHFFPFTETFGLNGFFIEQCCLGYPGPTKQKNFEYLIQKYNLRHPICIGDTHRDQIAAYASGANFIFAQYGFGQPASSCPSVTSFTELIDRLLQPMKELKYICYKASCDDLVRVESYYGEVGYRGKLHPDEKIYVAQLDQDKRVIGAVRLEFEGDVWVLRGMQIDPNYQGSGIGAQLVQKLISENDQEIWCLPHSWLTRFYRPFGFEEVSLKEAPRFLVERRNQLLLDWPHLIIMKRERGVGHST